MEPARVAGVFHNWEAVPVFKSAFQMDQGWCLSLRMGSGAPPIPAATTLKEFKDLSERLFLVQKLRENEWNISRTADVIDTPRSNLYKKLEQYAISQETDG